MAYNRENLLKRIIKVQNIVLEYKEMDVPYKRIYEKHIKEQFNISYSTFNEYMGMSNVNGQLKKLQDEKQKKKEIDERQQKLF